MTKFAQLSCECGTNVARIFMCCKLVVKVLNMFENFVAKYFTRLLYDSRATVVICSRECQELVATKFWRIYNAKISRQADTCMNIEHQS